MEDFGSALRSAREAAGSTVEQVSASTRIRPDVVRDLEAGGVTSSGGAVYARGHVRSIARVLGVDPAPLLDAFDAATGSTPASVPLAVEPLRAARASALQVPRAERPERTGPRWGAAAGVAGAVLVALLGVGVVSGQDRPPVDDVLAAVPAEVPAPAAPARPPAPDAQAAVPPAPAVARLGVRAVDGASWVRVQAGERTLFEGVLAEGEPPQDFTDPGELRLLVGNGAALRLSCGGDRVEPAGGPGEVKRFTCGRSGLAPA